MGGDKVVTVQDSMPETVWRVRDERGRRSRWLEGEGGGEERDHGRRGKLRARRRAGQLGVPGESQERGEGGCRGETKPLGE